MLVTQTVILAAGIGVRLKGAATDVPKPLLEVAGAPLVAHALAHAQASGCTEAVVVVGHEGARVRRAIEAIGSPLAVRFVETPDPTSPNGHSLLAAARVARPHFFLQMVDHLFGCVVLPALAAAPLGGAEAARVLVDRAPVGLDLDDATKVRLDGDRVLAIGKHIEPWDAVDAGCFLLTRAVFDALAEVPSGGAAHRLVRHAPARRARRAVLRGRGGRRLGGRGHAGRPRVRRAAADRGDLTRDRRRRGPVSEAPDRRRASSIRARSSRAARSSTRWPFSRRISAASSRSSSRGCSGAPCSARSGSRGRRPI